MLEDNYTELLETREGKTIREIIDKYIAYWFWFVLAAIVSVIFAIAYLGSTIPTYKSIASIIINNEESSSSGLSIDLGFFNGLNSNSLANELGVLRSKRLMLNTVRSLDLQAQYFNADEELDLPEIYGRSPLILEILSLDEASLGIARQNGQDVFQLKNSGNSNIVQMYNLASETQDLIELDSIVDIGFLNFRIKRNPIFPISEESESNIRVKIAPVNNIVNSCRSRLTINLVDENATLVELSIIDSNREKGKDILNQLIFEYNREAIEDKNLIARKTATFIDDRLKIINQELDSVEVGKEEFKENNKLSNISAESEIILQNASQYAIKEQEVGTQLGLVNSMIRYLREEETGLLPGNLGIENANINSMIDEYNSLVLERDRILAGATITNPIVVKLTNQIERLKNNVTKSLARERSNLMISKRDIQKQSGIIGSQISEVPLQERLFRSIERQQNIKEALYLFLLQKREENSLALAATAPKAKIVDQAYDVAGQVFPNPKKTLIGFLLIGLIVPFVSISIFSILNNKIEKKEDVEGITKSIPVLGQLPHLKKSEDRLVKENDRSTLSETLRILVSNLYYMPLGSKGKVPKIIFVTSSLKNEGKTFVAVNLAKMLAVNEKNTVLIGADLRSPQLRQFDASIKNKKGLSNYLADNNIELDNLLINSSLHKNLKILPSGPIPFNPAELLGKDDRTESLFTELKEKFDYVIVDTSPSIILADTFLINRYADLTLYMVRAGVTKTRMIEQLAEVKKSRKISNIGIIVNDVRAKNFGYDNKYTYDGDGAKGGFLSFLKRKK